MDVREEPDIRGRWNLATRSMCMSHSHRRGEVADDLHIDVRFDPYHFCSAICIMQLEISLILKASR